MDKQPLKYFELGTRRRVLTVPVPQSYAPNTAFDVLLPKVGLLHSLRLVAYVTASASAATAFASSNWRGAFGLLPNVILEANASTQIVNASAAMLNSLSGFSNKRHRQTNSQAGQTTSQSLGLTGTQQTLEFQRTVAPSGAGTFSTVFAVDLPVTVNDGLNYTTGMVNLQNEDVEFRIKGQFADFSSLFATPANITAVTGTLALEVTYYDIPDPSVYQLPNVSWLFKTSESKMDILSDGETRYVVPRGNTYARFLHQFVINNALATTQIPLLTPSGNIQFFEQRFQQGINDYKQSGHNALYEAIRRYGSHINSGLLVVDNMFDTGNAGEFEAGYNLVDSRKFSDIEHIFTLQGVSGTSNLTTLRQELVNLRPA